ncbi:MAG: hypothetical protein GF398_06645 [Chitinivibrionales bacterium]|nr:hypothetical protein [Chitinivibrionales bacterium]
MLMSGTHAVERTIKKASTTRVAMVTWGNIREELKLETLNEELLRHFESECSHANTRLDIYGYYFKFDKLEWENLAVGACELEDSEDILGYVFPVVTPEVNPEVILKKLVNFNKPIAILDLIGGWLLPPELQKPNVRVFSMAVSTHPGKQVGEFLLDLGHTEIAYISPFHHAAWSRNRFEGLNEAYAQAGHEGAVKTFTFDKPPIIHSVYHDDVHASCDIGALTRFYSSWKRKIPQFIKKELDPYFEFHIPERVLTKAALGNRLATLFVQALSNKDITAWVLANDDAALAAHSFLMEKKVGIGKQLSIIGFDDMYDTLRKSVTSFNFNVRAMASIMLEFIFHYNESDYQFKMTPVEVDGLIIERSSTCRI